MPVMIEDVLKEDINARQTVVSILLRQQIVFCYSEELLPDCGRVHADASPPNRPGHDPLAVRSSIAELFHCCSSCVAKLSNVLFRASCLCVCVRNSAFPGLLFAVFAIEIERALRVQALLRKMLGHLWRIIRESHGCELILHD